MHIESVELPNGKGATIGRGVTGASRKWGVHGEEGGVKPMMSVMEMTGTNSGNHTLVHFQACAVIGTLL